MGTYYKDGFGNLYEELPANIGDLSCTAFQQSVRLNIAWNNQDNLVKFCLSSKAINFKKSFKIGETSYTSLDSISIGQGIGLTTGNTYTATSKAVIVTSTDASASANYVQIQVTSSFNTGDVTTVDFGDNKLSSILIARCGLIQKSKNVIKAYGFVWVAELTFKDGTKTFQVFGNPCDVGMGKYWNGDYLQLNGELVKPYFDDITETKEDISDDTQGGSGGYGNGTNPTDNILIPDLPNIDINYTGSSLYALTSEQITQFTKYLWTSDWTDNIHKLHTNPMDNIISIGLCDIPITGSASNIVLGNLSTGINATLIKRWWELDCGSISIDEYYGTFADYEPYVKYTLYLPKIGFVSIPADVITNNIITIKYHVELSSGEGICYVMVKNKRNGFSYIYNTYTCNCVSTVALSATNYTNLLQAKIGAVTNVASGIMSGNPVNAVGNAVSSAINVATTKTPTETRGGLGNFSSLLCYKTPYLLVNATYLTKPSEYKINNGHASYLTIKISNLSGYVKTLNYHTNFECPQEVKKEIEELMNGGVYI